MINKSGEQNEFVIDSKANASPEVLSIVANLIKSGREDLSHIVLKVDYLLQYAEGYVKQGQIEEARDALSKARVRIEMIKKSGVETGLFDNILRSIEIKAKI